MIQDKKIKKKIGNWIMPASRCISANGKFVNSRKNCAGFSLIEMLVVIFVFSILGVVSTQILALSLRSSQKSESIGEVRANLEYAVSTMERLLRNAKSVDCDTSTLTKLEYEGEYGGNVYFELVSSGSDTYIASASSAVRLTSNRVKITNAEIFSCNNDPPGVPPTVTIRLVGQDAALEAGAEGASVTVETRVQLRTYEAY
jgi:prepilin-type N-terminal cleavage/methylation domain-containing protein